MPFGLVRGRLLGTDDLPTHPGAVEVPTFSAFCPDVTTLSWLMDQVVVSVHTDW
jgi:hypothetical protein